MSLDPIGTRSSIQYAAAGVRVRASLGWSRPARPLPGHKAPNAPPRAKAGATMQPHHFPTSGGLLLAVLLMLAISFPAAAQTNPPAPLFNDLGDHHHSI